MVFLIPAWISVALLVLRGTIFVLKALVEVVVLLLWVVGLLLYNGSRLAGRLIASGFEREPAWVREALKGIRRLPETER